MSIAGIAAFRRGGYAHRAVNAEGRHARAPLVAILAAATLLTLIAVSVLALRGIDSTRPLIAHTQAVQSILLRIRATLVDAETGQRGFLLLGDPRYLEPFVQAEQSLPGMLAELRTLTADDPSQPDRIAELDRLASQKMEEIRRTIELFEAGQPGASLAILRTGRGRSLMDGARQLIEALRAQETRLLAGRTGVVRRDLEAAMWIDAGAGLGLIILGFLLYAINRDIARREALEAALRDAARFQEQFVGILGHDLRNPLNAISMGTDLLLRPEIPAEDSQRALRRIASSAARMRRMVDQLLDLTRARLAGGIPVQLTPGTDLAEVARGAVDELRVGHPEAQLTLDAVPQIRGEWDADRIAQVVSNLVGNAISHGAGAPVDVQVKLVDGSATLAVHNGGSPIPADLLPGIFDPFHRTGAGRPSAARGLGLGLFITREIVLAHGGTIDVNSAQIEGTTFTVTLPPQRIQNSYAEARKT